jgi:hypothetical protein
MPVTPASCMRSGALHARPAERMSTRGEQKRHARESAHDARAMSQELTHRLSSTVSQRAAVSPLPTPDFDNKHIDPRPRQSEIRPRQRTRTAFLDTGGVCAFVPRTPAEPRRLLPPHARRLSPPHPHRSSVSLPMTPRARAPPRTAAARRSQTLRRGSRGNPREGQYTTIDTLQTPSRLKEVANDHATFALPHVCRLGRHAVGRNRPRRRRRGRRHRRRSRPERHRHHDPVAAALPSLPRTRHVRASRGPRRGVPMERHVRVGVRQAIERGPALLQRSRQFRGDERRREPEHHRVPMSVVQTVCDY